MRLFLFLSILLSSFYLQADIFWYDNFAAAQKVAREKKRPMVILFTGSDWCPWCIRLNQEILDTSEFSSSAQNAFVYFKADFPRKQRVPEEIVQQNEKLQRQYKVRGYPTLVIADASGEEIGRMGYQAVSANEYANSLKQYSK